MRASLGLYNSTEDVDLLCEALEAIAARQFERGNYRIDPAAGTYVPVAWKPDFDSYFAV